MITHGDTQKEWTQVREGCGKERRARDEEAKEGNVAEGAWWEGRQGEEQEAGDRDWIVGGAEEGRQGTIEAEIERKAQDERSQEDWRQKEEDVETDVEAEVVESRRDRIDRL
jgi:hypothetical protein